MNAHTELAQAVKEAAERGLGEVREAIHRVYDDLQVQIDHRKPVCERSGRCCRFDEFGHRLYVTTLELALFVSELDGAEGQTSSGCPFQIDGLCSVHGIRPFGCRVFFCDPTAGEWQNQQYERFHAQLKLLHGELGVPYFYVEWREALRACGVAGAGSGRPGSPGNKGGGKTLSLPQVQL
jgi:Fe-S-cluster containining protein